MFRDCLPNLYCADLDAALGFYRELLGFTETFRYPREGPIQHIELRLGSTTIALSSYDALVDYGLPPATPGTPFELAVRADDVDRAIEHLRAAGVPVLREPWDASNGQRVAYVTDPDGNRLHLYA
jgi:catechol 2,3-dioxygenase-like lactoylglutathione lyase family enzyme